MVLIDESIAEPVVEIPVGGFHPPNAASRKVVQKGGDLNVQRRDRRRKLGLFDDLKGVSRQFIGIIIKIH